MSGGNLWEMGRPQERQYNDTLSAQQGVEDTSAATKMSGMASAVSGLAQAGNTAISIYEKQKKAGAVSATNAGLEILQAGLEKEVQMREQGVSEAKISAHRSLVDNKSAAAGAGAKDRLAFRSKFEGTAFYEKSPELEHREAVISAGLSAGYTREDPEFMNKATRVYDAEHNPAEDLEGVYANGVQLLNDEITKQAFLSMPFAEQKAHLEAVKGNMAVGALRFPKAEAERVLSRLYKQVDTHIARLDPVVKASQTGGYMSILMDNAKLAALQSGDDIATLALLDGAFPKVAPALVQSLSMKAGPDILKFVGEHTKNIQQGMLPSPTATGVSEVYKSMSSSLSAELKETGTLSEQSMTQVATVAEQAPIQLAKKAPAEVEALVQGLHDGVAEAIHTKSKELDGQDVTNLQNEMAAHFELKVLPIVQSAVSQVTNVGRSGRSNAQSQAIPSALDAGSAISMSIVGDRVQFATTDRDQVSRVRKLNQSISKDLTTYLGAMAKLEGGTLGEQLAVFSPLILPEAVTPEMVAKPTEAPSGIPVEGEEESFEVLKTLPATEGLSRQQLRSQAGVDAYNEQNPTESLSSGFDPAIGSELLAGRVAGGETPTPGAKAPTSPMSGRSAQAAEERGPVVANPTLEQRALRRARAGVEAYKRMNPPGVKVDWDFIQDREGFETELYVPQKKGKVLDSSGVTVGMGIDLGTWGDKLEGLGVNQVTAAKLLPYAGKKGEAAKKFLQANPLELSEAEAQEVSQKVKMNLLEEIKSEYDKDAKNDFEDLTKAQQTVIASVFFQYGMDKTRKTWAKNFWKQVTEGRWRDAKKNLANFGDKYQSRRDLELEYLEE